MTQKQLNRFKVLSLVIEGKVTIQEAAEDLDLSERQIKRLKKECNNRDQNPSFTAIPGVNLLTQ